MSEIVNPAEIETIVGVERQPFAHFGRASSDERMFYILHSQACLEIHEDLRNCYFSRALDNGIDEERWDGFGIAPEKS